MAPWVYNPHSGGSKILKQQHVQICKQAEAFACIRPWYPKHQLKLRFKNQFCYVDTIEEGDDRLFPLCRLRNFGSNGTWSLALFTYSNERYEPCAFYGGKCEGTLEAALELCETFII
jgi:hypothetical protein